MGSTKTAPTARQKLKVEVVTGGYHPSVGAPVCTEFVTGGYGETSETRFAEPDQGRSSASSLDETTQMKTPSGSSKSSML